MNLEQVQQALEQGIYPETIRRFASESVIQEAQEAIRKKATPAQPAEPAITAVAVVETPVFADPVWDDQGTATFFESIAMSLLARGFKVAPCFPKEKKVHTGLVPDPLNMMSSEPAQISAWGQIEPNANVCVYAEQKEGGLLFLDKDGAVSLREKYERETGKQFPKTLLVRSSIVDVNGVRVEKGHWYFAQTPKTIALKGNISENATGGLFSLRVHNEYVASIGSIHAKTGMPYVVAEEYLVAPMPDDLLDWLLSLTAEKKRVNASIDGPPIPRGSHDTELFRIACLLRNAGMDYEQIKDNLVQVCEKRCENHGSDYVDMCEKKAKSACKYPVGQATTVLYGGVPLGISAEPTEEQKKESGETRLEFSDDAEIIPAFDPSVINGIYAKFVEVMTRGTTLVPQYAFLAAKTYIGLRLAGKVKFATVDAQPRYFGVAIGETGSGKGAAWSRMLQILNACGTVKGSPGMIKIMNGVDSGSGLKDFFFEDPQDEGVLLYVDEAVTYANKVTATRNPSALDDLLELVDQTAISRTLSVGLGKKKSKKKSDAHLAMYLCAQDGDVLQRLFAGRGKLGALDRLTPEYSVAVKPGRMPEISASDAMQLVAEVTAMLESLKGKTIGIQPEAEALLETFWEAQSIATQTKVRWRKYIQVDAYMSAFGMGRDTVTLGDMQIAIRIFERQLILRRAFFKNIDVTDKVGYYLAKCKVITEWMQAQQAAGKSPWTYAQSKRDYETKTHAYRAHEEAFFDKAWSLHSKGRLLEIEVRKSNGRGYPKYIPQPEEPNE